MQAHSIRICSVEGCGRPHRAKGWCKLHYYALREMQPCTIDGCAKPQEAHGWCAAHYARARTYGSPTAPTLPRKRIDPTVRFWKHVDTTGDCHIWTASCNDDGYGEFGLNGLILKAHRFAWTLAHGPIPAGLKVLHRCDNPPCVRKEHLFLGTQHANIQDMVNKGRSARGSKAARAKLTEHDVSTIRSLYADGCTQKELSQRFGVKQNTINQIVHHKLWTHVA